MISITKIGKTASVMVFYNFSEMYHQVIITSKGKSDKKGPAIVSFHSTNPSKLLDAIKTETGDASLAVNAMRFYTQQMALRCRELTAEVKTVLPALKAMNATIVKKTKGVVDESEE